MHSQITCNKNYITKMLNVRHILLPYLVITMICSWSTTANAAKILGLFAHPSESNFAVMSTLMTELAKREHNVTIYSSHRLNERIDNLHEIVIEPEYPFWSELQKVSGAKTDMKAVSQLPANVLQKALATVGFAATDYFLSHTSVQKLLQKSIDTFEYDLIIVDIFYTEALLALGQIHGIPTIGVVSTNFEFYMKHVLESMVPIACSPIDFETDETYEIGYWNRLKNIRSCMATRKHFAKDNFASQDRLIKKHFAISKDIITPTIPELQANLAVLLLNNHVPLFTPRPLLPNTITAGGLHIRPPRELPWHIRRFLDEARSGAIYMNLGNEQLCATIPADQLQLLFNVLGKLEESILWTCHDVQKLEGQPKNIMIQHMVPQTDILAHPHVKVFLTNGDLLSLQESIVRHVPMLGIPLFRNEVANMDLAVQLGVGIKLSYSNLTTTSLTWALKTLKYDTSYPITIRRVSTAFRDRPLGALETSMYWVDYILRHQGDAIKTRGVGIPSNQLHLFDLFVFYFGLALLFVGLLVGIYVAAAFIWKRRQVEKLYSKLN